jgi:DNA-binding NarL/FixJ family response regulator
VDEKFKAMIAPPPHTDAALLFMPVLLVEGDLQMRLRLLRLLRQLELPLDALMMAESIAQARERIAAQPAALALVDLHLPDGSGIDLIGELRASVPGLRIVVVSARSTREEILASLRVGAMGYLLKERDDMEMMLALRSALRGGTPIDPFVARLIIDELLARTPVAPADDAGLSTRENEVLHLVAQGLGNRGIAERLFVSIHTAQTHIRNIYRKLSVSSRTQAVLAARQRGLID